MGWHAQKDGERKKKNEGSRKAKEKIATGRKTKKSSLLCLSSKSKIEFLRLEMLVS